MIRKQLITLMGVLIVFMTATQGHDYIEDFSDDGGAIVDIPQSMLWDAFEGTQEQDGDDEGSGIRPTRPYKQCVKDFKECVLGSGRAWVDKHTCRLEFCKCRRRVCENYFKACQTNSWCSLKKVCSKAFKACRFNPKKESKCRRAFRKCLKDPNIDKKKTKTCVKTFNKCLTKRG